MRPKLCLFQIEADADTKSTSLSIVTLGLLSLYLIKISFKVDLLSCVTVILPCSSLVLSGNDDDNDDDDDDDDGMVMLTVMDMLILMTMLEIYFILLLW